MLDAMRCDAQSRRRPVGIRLADAAIEALGWFSTVPRQPGGEELAAAGFLLDAVGTDFVRGDGAARRCYNNGWVGGSQAADIFV